MNQHEKISYVEFPAKDLAGTKKFFTSVFGWSFLDFGTEYAAFQNEGINGGFYSSDLISNTATGSALIVFYSENLYKTKEKIEGNGGTVVKPIFSFPGGHRFHFTDPSGNEYAVWSDTGL